MGLLEAGISYLTGSKVNQNNLYHIDKINQIYGIGWDFNNQFIIGEMKNNFLGDPIVLKEGLDSIFSPVSQNNNTPLGGMDTAKNILNRHIVNVTFPALSTSTLESWIGSYWQYTTGRPVVGQMVLTFTDYNNYTLYNEFLAAFNILHDSFPEEQKWNITIKKILPKAAGLSTNTLDKVINTLVPSDYSVMIHTNSAMLESISELHFDQSNANGLGTFEVTFKIYEVQ